MNHLFFLFSYQFTVLVSQFVCKMDKLLTWTLPQSSEAYLISRNSHVVIVATSVKRITVFKGVIVILIL